MPYSNKRMPCTLIYSHRHTHRQIYDADEIWYSSPLMPKRCFDMIEQRIFIFAGSIKRARILFIIFAIEEFTPIHIHQPRLINAAPAKRPPAF